MITIKPNEIQVGDTFKGFEVSHVRTHGNSAKVWIQAPDFDGVLGPRCIGEFFGSVKVSR